MTTVLDYPQTAPVPPVPSSTPVHYPERDGKPMADNTKQFRSIVVIQGGLDSVFAERDDVFVAGDLLWYPVEGDNRTRIAPDVMVAFGRPKGNRGSYRQWEEGNIPPQVVFEVRWPNHSLIELLRKFTFYQQHGVQEYYLYDHSFPELNVALRQNGRLQLQEWNGSFTSPLLGVRFDLAPGDTELTVTGPDGKRFLTFEERAEWKRIRQERDEATARAERLAAQLRAAGIDPDA